MTGFSSNKGSGAKSFYIYRNCGGRNFEMLNDLFCGFEGVDGATPSFGDVNHDGLPDILIGGHGEKHEITTWLYMNRAISVSKLAEPTMMQIRNGLSIASVTATII